MMEPSNFEAKELEKNAVCEKHGNYVSKGKLLNLTGRVIWLRCPQCDADLKADEERKKAEEKAVFEKRKWQEIIGRSCLPRRFIGKTFDTFSCKNDLQKQAFEKAKSYADQFAMHAKKGTGLIFVGKPGTGKSHLAAAIIQKLMPDHFGLYATVGEIIRSVRETWRRDSGQTERQVLSHFIYSDLLVIDEIGVQYGSEGEKTVLFDVLDGRYREMMPTILMGNIQATQLKDYLGERIADRLRETNLAIPFEWESHRKAIAGKETQHE